ncbi:hypothetical protein KC614_00780 [candidate division WWE3 bacterium]|uniref:Uncharacterized protein n=1 Tax=candidate division WWE3 bacterium TaxID=2053526 RepID=A0A955LK85_UNCKA|nr:hypothetical protein [candidate division WWE3 bacterium]
MIRKKIARLFWSFSIAVFPFVIVFPASTNYELKGFKVGGAVGVSDSDNYSILNNLADLNADLLNSSSYELGPGPNYPIQASVPTAPTFENTSDYYNKLHFVVATAGNPSDTLYAIAISTDDFVTTNYVQSDNTIGSVLGLEDYQSYTNWGGASGEFVVGLAQDTTYKIKIKAIQGEFTETRYGPSSSAATVSPFITFSLSGLSSGMSVEGVTLDVTSSANSVDYGELAFNTKTEAANIVTVDTNAVSGYQALVRQEGDMLDVRGNTIDPVTGTNAVPSTWPVGTVDSAYGYHSSDESLGTGNTIRFVPDDRHAAFDTTSYEVAYSTGPVTNEQTTIVYSIEVGYGQEAGFYSHTITYTVAGVF